MSWIAQFSNYSLQFLWSDRFWLPYSVTWEHLRPYTKGYETSTFLKQCFLAATVLSVIRLILTRLLFIPLGQYLGLRSVSRLSISQNPFLEDVFSGSRRPNKENIEELANQLNMPVKSVDLWFHKRRILSKTPTIFKFSESGWKFCFYTSMFCYGVYVLFDKDYLYDTKLSIVGYPNYRMPNEVYWYYMIELGYYLSELFWVFYGVRRSDFKVLIVHHLATIGLLSFSYTINHHRIGALILGLHDIADCWMESAKMFKYVGKHRISEALFIIFVGVWIVTRLTYFPFWIIHAIFKYGYPTQGAYPVYIMIVGWLLLLQFMHVYWFCLIVNIALQLKVKGDATQDCRSDSETSDELASVNGSPTLAKENGFILPDGDQTVTRRSPAVVAK